MSGYTLSYRDKWTNPVFRNLLEAAIWSWMCDTAAWKDIKVRFSGKLIHLKRGQIATSERFISEGFGIGRQVVRTFLDNLQNDHMITREITQSSTIITICNYEKYQSKEEVDNPENNQDKTQEENQTQPTPNPNKKEVNKQTTVVKDISLTESPREHRPVDNSRMEKKPPIPEDENLNLFVFIEVVCERFGRKLGTKEQEAVADWWGKYPRHESLTIFDRELEKYRRKNPGKDPPATYFSPVLKGAFLNYQHPMDGIVSGLAGRMKV